MTSHRDSHNTTDVKPEMIPGAQTGNGIPHDEYNIRGLFDKRTNRKDDIFIQKRLGQIFACILEWGQGTCKKSSSYPARAYTTLVVLVLRAPLEIAMICKSVSQSAKNLNLQELLFNVEF